MVVEVEDALVERYQRDGAVLVEGVFDDAWVEKVRRGIAQNMVRLSEYSERLEGSDGGGAFVNDYCNWTWIEEFKEYVFRSPAAALAARFMKSSQVSFYHEHVLNKEPGSKKWTPWHHDQPYYPINGDKVCSLWMPVDPVPSDTCVQFVAGSHLWPQWFIPRTFAKETNYPLNNPQDGKWSKERQYNEVPVKEIEDGKWPILKWECKPGDVVIFHMRTLHGAQGNTSSTTHRRVLSTRWLGDDAVMASRPWQVSPPITGGLLPGQRAVCKDFPLVHFD